MCIHYIYSLHMLYIYIYIYIYIHLTTDTLHLCTHLTMCIHTVSQSVAWPMVCGTVYYIHVIHRTCYINPCVVAYIYIYIYVIHPLCHIN